MISWHWIDVKFEIQMERNITTSTFRLAIVYKIFPVADACTTYRIASFFRIIIAYLYGES